MNNPTTACAGLGAVDRSGPGAIPGNTGDKPGHETNDKSGPGAMPGTSAPPERAITFGCEGETLIGVLHLPSEPTTAASAPAQGAAPAPAAATPLVSGKSDLGVVVIVGGPQVRVGSHRQFLHLARHLAGAGHPVLRFDVRGMGDSTGAQRGFEHITPDIGAAITALQQAQPQVQRVVLWGLCDGASAALLYLDETADARVAGLALANPWVRSETTLARTRVKHYYRQRLMQREFWLKLLSGRVAGAAVKGLWQNVMAARRGPAAAPGTGRDAVGVHDANSDNSDNRGNGGNGGNGANSNNSRNAPGAAAQPTLPYPDRMARAWRQFPSPVLLLLSGRDYTAREFEEAVHTQPAWRGLLARPSLQREDLPDVDHTFSADAARQRVAAATSRWLHQLAGGAGHAPLA